MFKVLLHQWNNFTSCLINRKMQRFIFLVIYKHYRKKICSTDTKLLFHILVLKTGKSIRIKQNKKIIFISFFDKCGCFICYWLIPVKSNWATETLGIVWPWFLPVNNNWATETLEVPCSCQQKKLATIAEGRDSGCLLIRSSRNYNSLQVWQILWTPCRSDMLWWR